MEATKTPTKSFGKISQIKGDRKLPLKALANRTAPELANRQKEQAEYRAALAVQQGIHCLIVDPQWGFVVIGAGRASNIGQNAVLLMRDGRSINRLKVTLLERIRQWRHRQTAKFLPAPGINPATWCRNRRSIRQIRFCRAFFLNPSVLPA